MRRTALKRAIYEAQRFLELAKDLDRKSNTVEKRFTTSYVEPGQDSAATRRASMDLTRALADLRQGRE